jgi:hypothetical protein
MALVVKDTDLGYAKLIRQLKSLGGEGIYGKAGVIGEKAATEHEAKGANDEPLTNAELALIHEFGAPAAAIPERSFIRESFDRSHPKYDENMRKLVGAIFDGKITLERAMGLLSKQVAQDIQAYIREGSGVPPPNAPATIAAKGSSRPLVDTGQLVGAITNAVVRGNEGETG